MVARTKKGQRNKRRKNIILITRSRVYIPPPKKGKKYKSLWELLYK